MYHKTCDRMKKTATWKNAKQIWMLRTAKAYLERLVIKTRQVGNDDIHKVLHCVKLLKEVIENQIDLKEEKDI